MVSQRNLRYWGVIADSLAKYVYRNQKNLYPRVPTVIVELLQYSGLGSNTGMGFLRERRVAMD